MQWKVRMLREALAELTVRVLEEPCAPGALNEAITSAGIALQMTEDEPPSAPKIEVRQ